MDASEIIFVDEDILEEQRREKIEKVLDLVVSQGMSIVDACDKVGISRSTYYRLVQGGYLRRALAASLANVTHDTSDSVVHQWPLVIENMVKVALGVQRIDQDGKPYTPTVKEQLEAAKTLHTMVIQPLAMTSAVERGTETDFLKGKAAEESAGTSGRQTWTPQLVMSDMEDGDQINITVSKGQKPIDVTPSASRQANHA